MRTRTLAVLAVTVAMVVAGASSAGAVSHLEPEDEIPTLSFFFDPVLATLYFDVFDPAGEGDELADCAETPVPDGCTAVEVREPANHGAVVSGFVHALKDNPDEWSGPKGQLVRQIAQSDAGKKDKAKDDEPEEAEEVEEPDAVDEVEELEELPDRVVPPELNQPGPPPHANANGRQDR